MRDFPAGSALIAVQWASDGRLSTVYWCDVCDYIWQEGEWDDDGVCEGGVRDSDTGRWDEVAAMLSKESAATVA